MRVEQFVEKKRKVKSRYEKNNYYFIDYSNYYNC